MSQADFSYSPGEDVGSVVASIAIFSDRDHVRQEWCEDADMAGFRIERLGRMADAPANGAGRSGDITCIDCPDADGARLAALAAIDGDVARLGGTLLVVTSAGALDDVFACADRSAPRILVDPSQADRLLALGLLMARKPRSRVRELSSDDRVTLLRLTEQVGAIAERLERLGEQGLGESGGAFRLNTPGRDFRHGEEDGSEGSRLIRKPKPPLPDPRLVRRIIEARQLRARHFDAELFADPAWDILLDLTAARAERKRVSVTSLCIASGVPPTTALRWIGQMVESGLLERVEDDLDKRRAFIQLSDGAAEGMARYFAELHDDPVLFG